MVIAVGIDKVDDFFSFIGNYELNLDHLEVLLFDVIIGFHKVDSEHVGVIEVVVQVDFVELELLVFYPFDGFFLHGFDDHLVHNKDVNALNDRVSFVLLITSRLEIFVFVEIDFEVYD